MFIDVFKSVHEMTQEDVSVRSSGRGTSKREASFGDRIQSDSWSCKPRLFCRHVFSDLEVHRWHETIAIRILSAFARYGVDEGAYSQDLDSDLNDPDQWSSG